MPLKLSPTQVAFNARGDGKFNKPFQEQVDFFRQKLNLPTEHYDDIIGAAHDRAFVVAGAMKADLLNDLRGAVDKAIADGKSIQWFRKEFGGIVQANGWEGWTGSDTKPGRDWRTRVIYNTNLSASYAAGRYAQLTHPDLLKSRPYWKYIHNDTVSHPRPLHVSWSGLVLPYDDEFWSSHFPPNGWGCRCRITAVPASAYEGAQAPDNGVYVKTDRWGKNHVIPKGIDYGWDYPPGASVTEQLRGFVDDKAKSLPPVLGKAFKEDVASIKPKPLEFVAAKTTKEAAKWAVDNNLVDYADYGAIKAEAANEMNKSLLAHLSEFPALRQAQKFIGTGQAQFKRWQELASKDYYDALIERGYPEADAKRYVDRRYKKPKMGGTTWMHSWSQPQVSGIAINEKWGKDYAGFLKSLDVCESTKFHPIGCNTVKSVVDHELGHQLDDLLGLDKHAEIVRLREEALAAGITDNLSKYAGMNIKEFVAEAWAEALNSEAPRHYATEVARIIRDEYAKQFPA